MKKDRIILCGPHHLQYSRPALRAAAPVSHQSRRQKPSGCRLNSAPRLPDIRHVSHRGLPPIPDDRLLKHALVLEHFFSPILRHKIFDQRQQVFILAFLIDHLIQTADRMAHLLKLALTEPFLLEIDILEFDPSLFKKAFCLARIRAFFCAKIWMFILPPEATSGPLR